MKMLATDVKQSISSGRLMRRDALMTSLIGIVSCIVEIT